MRQLRWTRLILLCVITRAAARYECDQRPSMGTLLRCFIGHRVLLTVFTRSGRAYGGRLLPATACSGFLLSPLIEIAMRRDL